jgi:hemoglobin
VRLERTRQISKELGMNESLYERIGGEPAVEAAVDVFYRKVLADERISRHFDDVDMDRQRQKQKAFLTFAFGGGAGYTAPSMRAVHARLRLTEADFDAVMGHLGATLAELGVPAPLIQEAAQIALSVKDDVLGR